MLKHVCDVCGKTKEMDELDVTIVRDYQGMPAGLAYVLCPREWVVIDLRPPILQADREELTKRDRRHRPAQLRVTPGTWIKMVCSQACGEKALDEAKGYLRELFQRVEEVEKGAEHVKGG